MPGGLNDISSDELIRHNISLLRYDAKLRRQILGQLRVMQESLILQLSATGSLATQTKLNGLLSQVDSLIKKGYSGINAHMLNEMQNLAGVEQQFAANTLNNLFKVDIISAGLTPQVLRAMGKNANILGAPAKEWWGRQSANMRKRFGDQMRQGFLLGESTGDLVRRVRGTATGARTIIEVAGKAKSVAVFSGGLMNISTREATALVRTSINSVANEVRLATYMNNTDVIQAVQAVVTLDSRTSDVCIAKGNRPDEWTLPDFEPVGGSTNYIGPPPWHYNCRSSLAPITKSWEQLQKQGAANQATTSQKRIARLLDNNAAKATRASMNGQVPKALGYSRWLKTQPKSVQLEVLGPTRRELWREGKLNLTQLIDQTGRPQSLTQIARGSNALTNLPSGTSIRRAKDFATSKRFDITLTDKQKFQIVKKDKFWYEARAADQADLYLAKTRGKAILELEKRNTIKKPPPSPPKKPPKKAKGTTNENGTNIVKDPDFEHNGDYHITLNNGKKFTMYRDQGTGWWYDSNVFGGKFPGDPPPIIGFTKKEAIAFLEKKGLIKVIKKPPVIVKPPPPTKLPPPSRVVKPGNLRSLELEETFLDEAGQTWKVFKVTSRTVRAFPWSVEKGRFLTAKGTSFNFVTAGKTVKQFKQLTGNIGDAVKKLLLDDKKWGNNYSFTIPQQAALDKAIKIMSENGFNHVLAERMGARNLQAHIFNMGGQKNKMVNLFGRRSKSNHLGSYWNQQSAIGMKELDGIKGMLHTWVHEFGHHMDYTIMRRGRFNFGVSSLNIADTKILSKAGKKKWLKLTQAYDDMQAEYIASSRAVGRKLGLRMKKGKGLSENQQRKNWYAIEKVMKGHAQSSYSLHNEFEWFAETWTDYFGAAGSTSSRAMQAKISPFTHAYYELLMSSEMELLWKELMP